MGHHIASSSDSSVASSSSDSSATYDAESGTSVTTPTGGGDRAGPTSPYWQRALDTTPNFFAAPQTLDSAHDAALRHAQRRLSIVLLVTWLFFVIVMLSVYSSQTTVTIITLLRPTQQQFIAALADNSAPNCPCVAPTDPSTWVKFTWSPLFNTSSNICSVARGYGSSPTYNVATESLLLTIQLCNSLDRMAAAATTAVASFRGAGVNSLASQVDLTAAIETITIAAYTSAFNADLNTLGEMPNLNTPDPAATARRTCWNTRMYGETRLNSVVFSNDPSAPDANCSCLNLNASGVGPVPACSYLPPFIWDSFSGPGFFLNNSGGRSGWWECAFGFFLNYYSRFPLHAIADPRFLSEIVVGAINDPTGVLRNASDPIAGTQFFGVNLIAAALSSPAFGPAYATFNASTLATSITGNPGLSSSPLNGMLTPRHLYDSASIHIREADYWSGVIERYGFGFSAPLPPGPLSWSDGVLSVDYNSYFTQCAAPSCTYIKGTTPSLLNVMTTGISLAGGSFTALRHIFGLLWVSARYWRRKRRASAVLRSGSEANGDWALRQAMQPSAVSCSDVDTIASKKHDTVIVNPLAGHVCPRVPADPP